MADSVISGNHYHFAPPELFAGPATNKPLVPIRLSPGRDPVRDTSLESRVTLDRSGVPVVRDGFAVVRLDLDVEAVDWLLDELDGDNLFTTQIAYAAALARHSLWERVRSSDWALRGDEG